MKRIQLALAAILLASLTLYGWAQQTSPAVESRESESNIALARHEARIVAQLKLTAKQKAAYDKLQAWLKAENAKLGPVAGAPSSGQISAGQDINRKLHEGLKSIFTPAQYRQYMQLWQPSPLKFQDPMASGEPFGGTDEAILNELKLTSAQWQQYREYQKENLIKLEEFRALAKTDPRKAGFMGGEINRWTRATMKKILTEDQYYEWVYRWDEIMSTFAGNGASQGTVRRSAGGGTTRPIAGKAGGG